MMYIVFDNTKKILRLIDSSPAMSLLQAKDGAFIMEGTANDITQKIEFDGLDVDGQPINPKVVDKTPEEIEAEKPTPPPKIPYEKQVAYITNEKWQEILDRLDKLEK